MRRSLTVLAAVIALAGCGSGGDEAGGSADESPSAEATSAEASDSASPSEKPSPTEEPVPTDDTPDQASDGTDLSACYDGSCEIEISEPTQIEFDPKYDMGAFLVTEIGEDYVSLSMMDGVGSGTMGVGDSGAAGGGEGTELLGYTLMSIDDGTAIIAFYPRERDDD